MESVPNTIPAYAERLRETLGEEEILGQQGRFRTTMYRYGPVLDQSKRFAHYLREQGVSKGDTVLLRGPNHPGWVVTFMACAYLGAVVVPLDNGSEDAFIQAVKDEVNPVVVVDQVEQEGLDFEDVLSADNQRIKSATVEPDDVLEIVYTSGTTSEPKGVRITHENITANIRQLRKQLDLSSDQAFLSLLPLSHAFEQVIGFFLPMRFGHTVVFAASRRSTALQRAFHDEGITAMTCVPAFLSALRERLERISLFGVDVERLPRRVGRSLLRKAWNRMAPDVETFIVGGAPLSESLETFWDEMGVDVLQGYGLTETSPVVACNTKEDRRVGSVGTVLPEQDVRLGVNDEIQVKGPNVTSGYYNRPDATNNAFTDDGYFKTGDVGRFDDDDFLFVTGRVKNMIVLDSGMNVYPEDIEPVIQRHGGVDDACVVTDENNALVGVVTGDPSDDLLARVNEELSSHQQLTAVRVWPAEDFPRTRTKKIRRDPIQEWARGDERGRPDGEDEDRLIAVLAEHGSGAPSDASEDSVVVEAFGIDSVSRIAVLDAIEDEFGVEIHEAQLDNTTTVRDLRELINQGSTGGALEDLKRYDRTRFGDVCESALLYWFRNSFDVDVAYTVLPEEPFVLVANHNSHLDTLSVLHALPEKLSRDTNVAAAADYFFDNPVMSSLARKVLHAYPFSRDDRIRDSLQRTGRLLDHGKNVVIYPEGTRGRPGEMTSFKQGIGVIGKEMDAPIVPSRVEGTGDALPKGTCLPRRQTKISVRIGEAITVSDAASYEEATRHIEDAVRGLR
jgi:long-chain acyl-CoA synthetase